MRDAELIVPLGPILPEISYKIEFYDMATHHIPIFSDRIFMYTLLLSLIPAGSIWHMEYSLEITP